MRSHKAIMYCATALACGAATLPRQPVPTPAPAQVAQAPSLPALRCEVPFDAIGNAWLERVEWTETEVDGRAAATSNGQTARIVHVDGDVDAAYRTIDLFNLACDGGAWRRTIGEPRSSFVPQASSFSQTRIGESNFDGIAAIVVAPLSNVADLDWEMMSSGGATVSGRYVGERTVGAVSLRDYDVSVNVHGTDRIGGMGARDMGRPIFQRATIALTGRMTLRSADGAFVDLKLTGKRDNTLGVFDIVLHARSSCFDT